MQVNSIAECSKGEHSAILLTFIKLPFVIKSFVLSIFEWPLKTGFTVVIINNMIVIHHDDHHHLGVCIWFWFGSLCPLSLYGNGKTEFQDFSWTILGLFHFSRTQFLPNFV